MIEEVKKKTVGQEAYERLKAGPNTADAIELEREMHKDYEKNIFECIERGRKFYSQPFYVCVDTKKEKVAENIVRNLFYHRLSCPTPTYDQTVYFFDRDKDTLEFIWVIPSKDTCLMFIQNWNNIVESERDLLTYILQFASGKLDEIAQFRNGELIQPLITTA